MPHVYVEFIILFWLWIRSLELVCGVQEEEEALLETVLGEK
jgi:hypothetical protein